MYIMKFVLVVLVFIFFSSIAFSQKAQNVQFPKKDNINLSYSIMLKRDCMYGLKGNERTTALLPWKSNVNSLLSDTLHKLVLTLREQWDTTNHSWVNYTKDTISYDDNGNSLEQIYCHWNGSQWIYISKIIYGHNANGLIDVFQDWKDSVWVNRSKEETTIDSNGILKQKLSQNWVGNTFINSVKQIYTCDSTNVVLQEIFQRWINNLWVDVEKATYIYDSLGNKTEDLFQNWVGSAWKNYSKVTYTYNDSGNNIEELYENWGGTNWMNTSRYKYSYDSVGNLTEELYQIWKNSAWLNSDLSRITYDRNYGESVTQVWENNLWVNSYNSQTTYNDNGNLSVNVFLVWKNGAWLNQSRSSYSWQSLVTGVYEKYDLPEKVTLLQNYPNPFNPATTINYTIRDVGTRRAVSVLLEVYNTLGQMVATLVNGVQEAGNKSVKWDASNFSTGVYYYRLQVGEFVQTKKLLLAK